MKKIVRILAITLALLLAASVSVFAVENYDVNNDGSVNDEDVIAIIRSIAENGGYISAFDIRSDSIPTINVLDAIAMKNYVEGFAPLTDDNWTAHWY